MADEEREKATDDGVWISGAARLSGLYLVRARDVLAQIPALEGGRPRRADMCEGFLPGRLLDEVFAGETEDAGGGYEVAAVVAAEITDSVVLVLVRISYIHRA